MDNTSELNYKIAKDVLGIELRAFTDENISPLGAWLDWDAKYSRGVIEAAMKDHVVLELKTWHKGLVYTAVHNGWHFEYKIPITECYSAHDHVVMEGDLERWLSCGLIITPAPVPDYCNEWLACLTGWKQFKERYRDDKPALLMTNRTDNPHWTAEIHSRDGLSDGLGCGNTPQMALALAMINSLETRHRKAAEIKGFSEYEYCPHCKGRYSFAKPTVEGFCPFCRTHVADGRIAIR
jgi:hypothetical protein